MRLLTIEGAILDKHRQSYGDALNHAIDDLLSGKDLHLRNRTGLCHDAHGTCQNGDNSNDQMFHVVFVL